MPTEIKRRKLEGKEREAANTQVAGKKMFSY
jgi:hypothetical protein